MDRPWLQEADFSQLSTELQDQIWDEVTADTIYAKERYNPLSFPIEYPSGMYAWFGTWLKPDFSFALAPDGSHLTKSALKVLLHNRHLKTTGNKSQLISRLQGHDKAQPKDVLDTPEKKGYIRLCDGDKARLCGSRTKKPILLNWDWYKTDWSKLLNTLLPTYAACPEVA